MQSNAGRLSGTILGILLFASASLVPQEPEAVPYHEFFFYRQARSSTPLINIPNEPDYQASAIRNPDGTLDVWYCTSTLVNGNRGDAIFKARFDAQNQPIGSPTLALQHTQILGTPDGRADCDVSVIKHGSPGLTWPGGSISAALPEIYFMYYECSPHVTNIQTGYQYENGPNQICLAASVDGVHWMDHNSGLLNGDSFQDSAMTTPTPVVARDPQVNTLCNFSETLLPNQYAACYTPPVTTPPTPACGHCDSVDAYGSGHPSAVSVPTGPTTRKVYLYYYDSKGGWNQHGIYRRESSDGIHFVNPQRTVGMNAETGATIDNEFMVGGKIRYFDVKVGDRQGVYVAITDIAAQHYFAYSFDGLKWVNAYAFYPPGYAVLRPELRLAEAVSEPEEGLGYCAVPGDTAIVGDKYGMAKSLSGVEMLSGEGKLGSLDSCYPNSACTCYSAEEEPSTAQPPTTMRGKTWSLYWLKGDFGHIATPSADVCVTYDEQNLRDQSERGQIARNLGYVWMDQLSHFPYASFAEFQARNFNLGERAYTDVDNPTFDRVNLCGRTGTPPSFAHNDVATVARGMAANISILGNDVGILDPASVQIFIQPSHGTVQILNGRAAYTSNAADPASSDTFVYSVATNGGQRSNLAGVQINIVAPTAVYRVNAGGPAVAAGGWTEDRSWSSGGVPSSRVNALATGDKTYPYASTVTVDSSVPIGTPPALFEDDRYALPNGTRMKWEFPVDQGQQVEVRLYFAENYRTTAGRVFDVKAEAVEVVTNLDPFVAAGGAHKGIMRSFKTFVDDGLLNLEFFPNVGADSPLVDGIEILGVPLGNPVPVAVGDFSKVVANPSPGVLPNWKTRVNVLENDSDASPGTLNPATVTIVNPPLYGSISVNTTTGAITYTNTNSAQTADRFSYTVKDNLGALSNTAVVTIAIKPVSVLFRVNAGGPAVFATPTWTVDTVASPSPYVNSSVAGNNNAYYSPATIANVPIGLSQTLFRDHRYDTGLAPNMIWNIPVTAGPEVEVRLYFAETYYTAAGQRVFGVKIENDVPYPSLDIFQLAVGANRAYSPQPFRVSSDDTSLRLEFLMGAASAPIISAIEVRGPANN